MVFKSKRFWTIVSTCFLLGGTVGFGVLPVTLDKKIAELQEEVSWRREVNQTAIDAFNDSNFFLMQTNNTMFFAKVLGVLGDKKTKKALLNSATDFTKKAALRILFTRRQLVSERLNRGELTRSMRKVLETKHAALSSNLSEIESLTDFQEAYNRTLEVQAGIKHNPIYNFKYLMTMIEEDSNFRNLIWTLLLIVQTIGIAFGVLASGIRHKSTA